MTAGARVVGVACCPGDPATTAPPVNTITMHGMETEINSPPFYGVLIRGLYSLHFKPQ